MRVEESQLKVFLLDSGLLKPDLLKKAEEEAGKSKKTLREVVLNRGYATEEEIKRLEAYILGIPFVDLEKETIPQQVLKTIPEPIARKNNVIAYQKTGNNLEVAMLAPDDIQTIELLNKKERMRILVRLTTPESIKHALKQYQKTFEAEFGEIIQRES